MRASYIIGLAGMWLFGDATYSLLLYIGKPGEGWFKQHSIRLIRLGIGVGLMVFGGLAHA